MVLRRSILAVILAFFTATGAWALDLHAAKAQGLVGEAKSGYLDYVKKPPKADAKALVEKVNRQRRDKFSAAAKSNNLSVGTVAQRFYERAVKATKPGNYYQNSAGKWVKK